MTTPKLETLAERVWFAWHCLPLGDDGKPPSWRSLELRHGLPESVFSALVLGRRRGVETGNLMNLAAALRVKVEWLLAGEEPGPVPAGAIPPMSTGKQAPARRNVRAYLRRLNFEPARVEAALAALFDVTPP